MSNKSTREALEDRYGKHCMATGYEEDHLTYHHLDKAEHGGKTTEDNGALLVEKIHQWLHNDIERSDPELFCLINECLYLYKQVLDRHMTELSDMYEQEVMPEFQKKLTKRRI